MSDVIYSPSAIYRTPTSAPAEYICRRLLIPASLDYKALVNGALGTLCVADFFEETDGGMSIDDTIGIFLNMVQDSYDGCPSSGGIEMPIGAMFPCPTATPPTGCLECNGAQYTRVMYPDLYAALDASLIVDADNFIVPDMRDRTPVGSGLTYAVNEQGGEKNHTLTVSEMPAHYHGISNNNATYAAGTGRYGIGASVGMYGSSTVGESEAHNNMQPYTAVPWVIVAATS